MQVLAGYAFLGTAEELGSELAAAYTHAVDAASLACVREVAQGLAPGEAAAACHTFQDWAKLLPSECFPALLQAVRRLWPLFCLPLPASRSHPLLL